MRRSIRRGVRCRREMRVRFTWARVISLGAVAAHHHLDATAVAEISTRWCPKRGRPRRGRSRMAHGDASGFPPEGNQAARIDRAQDHRGKATATNATTGEEPHREDPQHGLRSQDWDPPKLAFAVPLPSDLRSIDPRRLIPSGENRSVTVRIHDFDAAGRPRFRDNQRVDILATVVAIVGVTATRRAK